MSSGAYESLYGHYGGHGHTWYDQINPPAREWLDGLVDHVAEHGEPNWAAVHRLFTEKYPDDAPDTDTTIKSTVRRLVKQRG
jgi:hypothetical protein